MSDAAFPALPDVRAERFTRLLRPVERTTEIQRSVFLARLVPVTSEAQAREVIETARREHHDARHHCSAFILGPDRDVQRSSDDGEPGGTAGVPMLQALAQRETAPGHRDLSDVAAVVTRWFGGILLGAGGLVRAYSGAVSSALDEAATQLWHRRRSLEIAVPMSEAGRAENALRALGEDVEGVAVVGTAYDAAGLRLELTAPDDDASLADVGARVEALLAGRATVTRGGAVWAP